MALQVNVSSYATPIDDTGNPIYLIYRPPFGGSVQTPDVHLSVYICEWLFRDQLLLDTPVLYR